MRSFLFLCLFLSGVCPLFAQLDNTVASLETTMTSTLFSPDADRETSATLIPPWQVDTPPRFKGGHKALLRYFRRHLDYTDLARIYAAEGLMILRLIIDAEGQPAEVEVLRGLGFGLDEQTADYIMSMPRWNPALVDGRAVATTCILPLRFRLSP